MNQFEHTSLHGIKVRWDKYSEKKSTEKA